MEGVNHDNRSLLLIILFSFWSGVELTFSLRKVLHTQRYQQCVFQCFLQFLSKEHFIAVQGLW